MSLRILSFEPHDASGDAWLVLPRELCPESGACARIDEHSLGPRLVEVGWRGLREISYLVTGEVAD